jgi:hypothetical protein
MAEIRHGAQDSQITPIPVLFRHPNHKRFNFPGRRRPTGLAAGATVVLVRDQPPVPAQQGLRRDNGCDFRQHLSSEQPGFGCKAATLVVGEAKPPAADLSTKYSVFLP